MKGDTSKLNLIKIGLLLAAALSLTAVCTLKYELFHPSSWWYLGFLLLTLGAVWGLVGFRPRRDVWGGSASRIILVYVLFYLLLIYALGLVTGFLKTAYSLSWGAIVGNTLPVIGVVIVFELLRYAVVKRIGDHKGAWVVMVIALSTLSVVISSTLYRLDQPVELFEFIGTSVMGGLASNIMLSFVAYKSDFRPTLIYALILAIYPFVMPIVPDLGPFVYSVLAIVLPTLLFMRFNEFFITHRPIPARQTRAGRWLLSTPALAGLAVVVVLVSGIFRYWALAIGSDSMSPAIRTGDVVIIDKNYGAAAEIEPGSVVAFQRDGQIITHRLIEVRQGVSGLQIQTKGDNNDRDDAWSVAQSDLVGVVRWRIPIIGWPTIWLERAF
jgi:signal peptidase